MNAIPLINNAPRPNINVGSIGSPAFNPVVAGAKLGGSIGGNVMRQTPASMPVNNETQLRQEINTSLVALKKEAGTLEGLINEAAQMLVTINNRIATLENDTVKKSDIVDVVQSGNLQPVTSNAVYQELKERGIIVAGVIRNSGNGWGLIGGGHEAINIDSVTTNNGNIVINYANIGNCNVVTFLATPDETFAGQNIYMGASVASDKATISIYQRQTATLKIVYNGSGFDVTVISADFTPNITVTKLDNTKINISGFLSRIVSITPIYESVQKINIYGARESGLTSSNMNIYVHCIDGQSVIDTSCRFLISIEATKKIDADALVSEWGNIWLYGLMKKI